MATNGNDEYFPEPSEDNCEAMEWDGNNESIPQSSEESSEESSADSCESESAKNYLNSISNMDERREKLCRGYAEQRWGGDVFITLMNCQSLFPSDEDKRYFVKFALTEFHSSTDFNLMILKMIKESNFNMHDFRFEDGKSAVHYLASIDALPIIPLQRRLMLPFMEFFLENAEQNYQDEHGYTYLHGACMSGNVTALNMLLSQGVDVNLNSYRYAPLHIAAQYRNDNVVEILLRHRASPNQPDHERSTPLHALARLRICDCDDGLDVCDRKRPVDKLVEMLVGDGAELEARNSHGDTPLQLAVSRFDRELVEALLKRGASISNLNDDRMFSWDFSPLELRYPYTLWIIETIRLLQSAGYEMDFQARFRMIKLWMRVRGNDADYILSDLDHYSYASLCHHLSITETFGFYIHQNTNDFWRQKLEQLRPFHGNNALDSILVIGYGFTLEDAAKMNAIKVTEDISLYQLCQMNYSEGYSILKNIQNWRIPPMDQISGTTMNIRVKRHIGNILMRRELELFVSDLFMTNHCQLNLPHTACRKITEYMSYEDLLRICEQIIEDN
ncbi:ankyrin-3-like [Trichogramma pretiosum]|uniref:ankyrin-3-like n=1 Tax=Trichogramma pretiosum TaxID=7493 RepID=UPI0006C9E4AC|nr:ankyrin-3-like [Trichogramma pretiosum]